MNKNDNLERIYCSCEGWEAPCDNKDAALCRMNTNYVKEEDNWKTLCPECQEACRLYWEGRWKEYYGSL